MRIILSCLASAVALAWIQPAVAQDSGSSANEDVAIVAASFWNDRAGDRVNDWLYDASPSVDSIPVSRGRNRIGTVRGSSPWQHWSRQLVRVDVQYNVCDEPNGDVTWGYLGNAYVTYRTSGPDGFTNTQNVRFRSYTPLEITLDEGGLNVRVDDVVGINFVRDFDVLDRYSQAFRRRIGALSTLRVRFNAAERAAYERDPAAFERGVHIGIDDQCDT